VKSIVSNYYYYLTVYIPWALDLLWGEKIVERVLGVKKGLEYGTEVVMCLLKTWSLLQVQQHQELNQPF
jgi:hypothetical protein